MATPTSHVGIIKPGNNDPFNIQTLNADWDTIDENAERIGTNQVFDDGLPITNSVFTFASGWSKWDDSGVIRRFGPWAYLYLRVKKSSAISISDTNDIAQEHVGTVAAAYAPMQHSRFKSLAAGRMAWAYLDTDRTFHVTSISGGNAGTDLAANSILTFAGYFMLASA